MLLFSMLVYFSVHICTARLLLQSEQICNVLCPTPSDSIQLALTVPIFTLDFPNLVTHMSHPVPLPWIE